MQWHDVTRKILGGSLGGARQNFGGAVPPWHPPRSAPARKPALSNHFARMVTRVTHEFHAEEFKQHQHACSCAGSFPRGLWTHVFCYGELNEEETACATGNLS